MNPEWQKRRIDVYLAAVIIPSIILGVLALWALAKEYQLVSAKSGPALSSPEDLGSFGQISIFAFAMIIFALFLILLLGTYLSSHNMQRELELTRLKSDFVSTVSHELKTPLTSIRLLAERLVKLPREEITRQKEYHNIILIQSFHLSRLINNILDFSKLEEGRQAWKFEKNDLAKVIRDSLNDYPRELIRPDCKIEVLLPENLPLFYLDKEAIGRAFINLFDNALKFSPTNGLIKINLYKTNDARVCLEVTDQGPGIAEQEKDKIFQRFYHKGKGTGIGLFIARHIMQGHKGRVEFISPKAQGATFKLILPLRTVESNKAEI